MFIILLTAISLSFVSAAEISFTSPEQAEINEEFIVSISADFSDTSDVKAFVHTSEDTKISSSEIISLIYNEGQWKNPWYYLNATFPEIKDYKVKATKSAGDRQICIRLRKLSSTSYKQECKPIKIIEAEFISDNSSDTKEQEPKIETKKTAEEKNITTIKEEETKSINTQVKNATIEQYIPQEPIILNKPQEEKDSSFVTSLGKKEFYIFGSFIVLCIIIIILLALRKL